MIPHPREIRAVERGELDKEDNPLKNAPHTAAELLGEWNHAYSREQAAYPLASLVEAKYWPPVERVDNVYGDRNLTCSCPPIEAYSESDGRGGRRQRRRPRVSGDTLSRRRACVAAPRPRSRQRAS